MLDSLPGAPAKADASSGRGTAGPLERNATGESSRGQTARHSLLNDSALLAALPFALRAASMMNERPQAAGNSPSLASPAMKGPKSENSGASVAAGAKAANVGRLVGERAFHFGPVHFRGRDREPHARGQRAIRAGRRFRRRPYGPSRSQRRKRPFRRLFAGRGHARETLGRRRPTDCKRGVPDANRLSHWRAPIKSRERRAGGRARGRAQPAESPTSPRLRRPPESRPPPRSTRQRNRAARRPTAGPQIRPRSPRRQQRKQTCSARSCRRPSPQGRRSNSTARRPARGHDRRRAARERARR